MNEYMGIGGVMLSGGGGGMKYWRKDFSSATLSPTNWPWIELGPLQRESGSYPPEVFFCAKHQMFHFDASNMVIVTVSMTGCSNVG
jgi:hypothetical protein